MLVALQARATRTLCCPVVFARQLQVASSLNLPVVVHSRDAPEDTLDILKANVAADCRLHVCRLLGTSVA